MTSGASGRPVRFFVILMGGWTAIRLVSVASGMMGAPSHAAPTPPATAPEKLALAHHPATIASIAGAAPAYSPALSGPPGIAASGAGPRLLAHAIMVPIAKASRTASPAILAAAPVATAAPTYATQDSGPSPAAPIAAPVAIPVAPPAPSAQSRPDRWRGSAWALWRDGSATPASAVPVGRLGGSQAGLRIDYDLTPRAAGRLAAYGRVSTAMNRPASPEGALGIAWQPARAVPISVAAERRIALGKGARDANALLLVGGFGPTPVLPGLEAEAYAQAGMVGFHRRDLFTDGKFSLMAPLGHSPLRIGGSVSGGAQPQVERLDIGPELQIRLPLPRVASRLSIEWRERIAGRAAPSSGLAVTLGADF